LRSILRLSGEICLTAGAVALLFVAYLLWGTGWRTAAVQNQFAAELNNQWQHAQVSSSSATLPAPRIAGKPLVIPPDPIHLAAWQPFAFIRIPAFGAHWRFTLIEGTELAQLNVAPGHVPGTQLPGQLGNFAVAGHRVTAGNPFWSLPSLRAGDLVYVDTQYNAYTYRVTGSPVWVPPTDTAVLDPVPGHPGKRPSRRLITLITCDPAWTGTHRVIVTGVLVAATPRTERR
jgi:sortase A